MLGSIKISTGFVAFGSLPYPLSLNLPFSITIFSLGYVCNRLLVLKRRTCASGTHKAGTFKVRSIPVVSVNVHATCPSPLISSPFAIPWSLRPKEGRLMGPTKSFRSGETESVAPESKMTFFPRCSPVMVARNALIMPKTGPGVAWNMKDGADGMRRCSMGRFEGFLHFRFFP